MGLSHIKFDSSPYQPIDTNMASDPCWKPHSGGQGGTTVFPHEFRLNNLKSAAADQYWPALDSVIVFTVRVHLWNAFIDLSQSSYSVQAISRICSLSQHFSQAVLVMLQAKGIHTFTACTLWPLNSSNVHVNQFILILYKTTVQWINIIYE